MMSSAQPAARDARKGANRAFELSRQYSAMLRSGLRDSQQRARPLFDQADKYAFVILRRDDTRT
jgi:hypothetical protein